MSGQLSEFKDDGQVFLCDFPYKKNNYDLP